MKIKIGKLYKSTSTFTNMMVVNPDGYWGKPYKTCTVWADDILIPCFELAHQAFVYFHPKNMLLLSEFTSTELNLIEIKNEIKQTD